MELDNPLHAQARDLFLFGVLTGISFIDIKKLTTDNIVEMNGSKWVVSKRQKTKVPFQIKLMDEALRIISVTSLSGRTRTCSTSAHTTP